MVLCQKWFEYTIINSFRSLSLWHHKVKEECNSNERIIWNEVSKEPKEQFKSLKKAVDGPKC